MRIQYQNRKKYFSSVTEQLQPCFAFLTLLTLLLGIAYPLAITLLAQSFFSNKANGSLIISGKMVIGSELLGQNFQSPYYFWPRPSATIPEYNPSHSGGSNLSPTNPLFVENIQERIRKLLSADGNNNHLIPIDLVTTSASGLDPHISVSAAKYQAARIARERQTSEQNIMNLIDSFIIPRQFGIFGENHLCVVTLNLQLDKLYPISHEQ